MIASLGYIHQKIETNNTRVQPHDHDQDAICALWLAAAVLAGIQLNRTNDVKSSSLLIEL